jgi:16S rRNA (adenine1518-N6/adenine1519-N6)-dimethyltransferase
MTLSAAQVADLLGRHGVRPRRALGQNFVVDPNTVRRVARLAGVGPGDHVLEVGPGAGSLTLALAERGAVVTAVEADARLLPVLEEVVGGAGAVRVVHGDALRADWASLLAGADRWTLVSNLPYNIATPLVAGLLDSVPAVARMTVMVQREVGERLCAEAGAPAYGAVSVKVAYWARARIVGRVPATVFWPRPNVESVLVSVERRAEPAVPEVGPEALFGLVRAGFAGRRKMLRRSLADLVGPDAFARAGVAPEGRAEDLDVGAWGRLALAAEDPSRAGAPTGAPG